MVLAGFHHSSDMIGCGSTAASDDAGTLFYDFLHRGGKTFRLYIIICLPVLLLRKSRIWLYDDRKRGVASHLFQKWKHLVRSEAAVHSDGIDSQSFKHRHNGRDISAGQKFSPLIEDHRGKYRKGGVFFRGKYRSFHLVGVTHGFYMDEICTVLFSEGGSFCKCAVRILKIQIAHGL